MVHLDYRDARPIYTQICDGIREQVLAGVLQSGDKLPSVREMAAQLTINPNTIQRAYRELELQGWIATAPGKGCFICGVPQNGEAGQKTLMEEFTKLAAQLQAMGVSREELLAALQEGGNRNA